MSSFPPDNLNQAIERLQNTMRGINVVILGSGASVDHGYPLMAQLADHLISSVIPDTVDVQSWQNLVDRLRSGTDLETALEDIQITSGLLNKIITATWQYITNCDFEFYNRITSENLHFPLSNLIRWLAACRTRFFG